MRRKLIIIILIISLSHVITPIYGISSIEEDSRLNEAKSYFFEGDLNTSLELINEYLIDYPINASAWNLKGMIYLQNNSYKLAEESFSEAINITPNDSRLYYNIGLAEFYQADLIHAEEYINRSFSKNFETPEQYFYLGLTQYGLTKYVKAIDSFKKSIELNPRDPAVWLNLGLSYEMIKRFDKAMKAYDEASKLDPTYSRPYFLKGTILDSFANSTRAVDELKNYTILEPDDDLGWFYYARHLRKIEHKNESLEALQKAISLNPDNRIYHEYLKIYDYGNFSGLMYDNIVTPLPHRVLLLAFGLMVIFSLIAVIRR